jgi:hypothetical protein
MCPARTFSVNGNDLRVVFPQSFNPACKAFAKQLARQGVHNIV